MPRYFFILLILILVISSSCCNAQARTVTGGVAFPAVDNCADAVVRLFGEGSGKTAVMFDEDEPYCVQKAILDVRDDFTEVSGSVMDITNVWPSRSFYTNMLIVGTIGESEIIDRLAQEKKIDVSPLEGTSEAFIIATVDSPFKNCDGALVVIGSDKRGTIYGAYEVSTSGLGIDPLHFWTEKPAPKLDRFYLADMRHVEPGPHIGFRGWFVNDEDFLKNWHTSADGEVSAEVYEHLFESMLRLRQNMVIPKTTFSLKVPNGRRIVELANEYGLLVTTHHAMTLGVWGRDWDIFWRERGKEVEYSFIKNREAFQEVWEESVEDYRDYMGIWQLGLRGKSDNAIWLSDKAFPKEPKEAAKYILEAVDMQKKILKEKLDPPINMTTTMWTEMLDLYMLGVLEYPEDVMLIISNSRGSLFHVDDIGWEKPFEDGQAGVYYHLAFHNSHDSHVAQTVHPYRMRAALDRMQKYNLMSYLMLNVSNLREYVMGVRAMADLTWRGDFDPEAFYTRWCEHEFGEKAAPRIIEAYKTMFDIPHRWGPHEDEHFMVGGMITYGRHITDRLLKDKLVQSNFNTYMKHDKTSRYSIPTRSYMHYWTDNLTWPAVIDWFATECASDAREWEALYKEVRDIKRLVPEERQAFYEDNMVLQVYTSLLACSYLRDVCLGVQAAQSGNKEAAAELFDSAAESIENLRKAQKTAEHGKWDGWYEKSHIVPFDSAAFESRRMARELRK